MVVPDEATVVVVVPPHPATASATIELATARTAPLIIRLPPARESTLRQPGPVPRAKLVTSTLEEMWP